jgi:hypothetical protein
VGSSRHSLLLAMTNIEQLDYEWNESRVWVEAFPEDLRHGLCISKMLSVEIDHYDDCHWALVELASFLRLDGIDHTLEILTLQAIHPSASSRRLDSDHSIRVRRPKTLPNPPHCLLLLP